MCLNNIRDTQRLLGGGLDISYVETLNGEGGRRVAHGPRNIAITIVVLGCRVSPVVVQAGYKTSNIKSFEA